MSQDDPQTLYRFFTEVGIINQLSSAVLEEHLPGRMGVTQFGLLGHLLRRPEGETPLQLARAFQVPKTSMTHMLTVLEAHDLVAIGPNPSDARSKLVVATKAAGPFVGQVIAALQSHYTPLLDQLDLGRMGETLSHLETIRTTLDAARDGDKPET